jgi:hypothetical protein
MLRGIDEQRQRLTVRRIFEGQRRDVLHLDAGTLTSPARKADLTTETDPDHAAGGVSPTS